MSRWIILESSLCDNKDTINLDDSNTIAATPQKIPKKKRYNTNKRAQVVQKSSISLNKKYSTTFSVCRNEEVNYLNIPIKEPQNPLYVKPFVFFDIHELVKFTEVSQPSNPNIKIIGMYKQKSNLHYLTEYTKIEPLKILLDIKLLKVVPVQNELSEMYGFVKFYVKNSKTYPVFVVKFWNYIYCAFEKYSLSLRQQRCYIPYCYKNLKHIEELSKNESSLWCFDEVNESCLVRNVDYIEAICKEVQEIMNISLDVFK